MKLADQLQKMGVHVEVKCPSHHELAGGPDKSHTLTEYCEDARIQWVQMSGSVLRRHAATKTPEEGWKENK
jgi:hypothetical protein